ncbi:MAG: hypothetical protein ACFCBU_02015, partial [Cyanophyceae cyanobacterium]
RLSPLKSAAPIDLPMLEPVQSRPTLPPAPPPKNTTHTDRPKTARQKSGELSFVTPTDPIIEPNAE